MPGIERRRFRPYPEYKDSGVEWLGIIPAHWEVKRIKNIARLHTGGTPAGLLVEAFEEEGIPWVKPEQLRGDCGIDAPDRRLSHDAAENLGKVKAGSTLVCGIGSVGKTGHAPLDVCTNQQINAITFGPKVIDRYGQFMVVCLEQEFIRRANKVTIAICNKSEMGEAPVCIPQADEQRSIASFLDRETGKIDALIEKKERLIELLQEKRAALITQAVTKGLDPTVTTKDSGIEWLGKIPAHWEVNRLKFVLAAPFKYGANEAAELDNPDLPRYVRITDIDESDGLRNETFKSLPAEVAKEYLLQEGDLLFARSGATAGKTFLYRRSWGTCAFAGYLIRARLDSSKACLEFIRYFTASMSYWQWLASTYIQATIQNVSAERYASLSLPLPPVAEQRAVAAFLDRQTAKIDALVTKIREAVTSLREYRTAFISAAVTGKIDVREA